MQPWSTYWTRALAGITRVKINAGSLEDGCSRWWRSRSSCIVHREIAWSFYRRAYEWNRVQASFTLLSTLVREGRSALKTAAQDQGSIRCGLMDTGSQRTSLGNC